MTRVDETTRRISSLSRMQQLLVGGRIDVLKKYMFHEAQRPEILLLHQEIFGGELLDIVLTDIRKLRKHIWLYAIIGETKGILG